MDDIEQEIDLDQITDESLLQSLLDQTDDPDDRKVIRERIKELKAQQTQAQAAAKKEAEEKMAKLANTREEMLQKKKQEAEAQKQRTMAMYDNMAKSAPAGANKQMDSSILRSETKTETKSTTKTSTTTAAAPINVANMPLTFGPRGDMVEDAIKKRQREAEERKARILAAYDMAAKSAPAGSNRDVDFDVVKTIDVTTIEHTKVESGATFQMNGGVPIVKVPQSPKTPITGQKPSFPEDSSLDAYERSLRERQRECEDRKRAMLDKYKQVSSQQAGPKVFV